MSDRPKPYMGQVMAECDCQHYGCVNRGYCMAARIEALVKERDEALEWLSASQGYIADAVFALDKQEKAEARAERLEAALREIAAEASVPVRTKKKGGIKHKWMYKGWRKIAVERIDIARAALKGDDHE